jgi:hypothetical protein
MDTWMLGIWIALAVLGYVIVIIGLAGLPMHARGRPRRIKWWAWVAMLAVGLAAAALGLGWFLVIAVAMTWATVTLFGHTPQIHRGGHREPGHVDAQTLVARSPASARATISEASSEQLCNLWLETGQEIRRTCLPLTLCTYAELRQAILDELTARDPDGVSRWLGDQPERRDLRAYLHDHQA